MLENDKTVQKLIDEIKEPLKEMQKLQYEKFDFIKNKVKYILINKISNKQEIEQVLDKLLDLAYWDSQLIKDTFYELINYYKMIDNNAANCYEGYYIEIIEE